MSINDLRILGRLKKLYSSGVVATAVIAYFFKNRHTTDSEVNVDDLQEKLQQENNEVSRQEVIDVLKGLQELGLGRFWTGRRGKPSRFQPYGSFASLSRLVIDESSGYAEEDKNTSSLELQDLDKEVGSNSITHLYMLRPNYQVEVQLPGDFNASEAERLAAYIKTLPFDRA
jgi:hypothetical protein